MTPQEQLDAQLWDYVFDLLDPAEARALEERITSEGEVARAYAEVRQRADLLALAARVEVGPLALTRPQEPAACEKVPLSVATAARAKTRHTSRPLAWLLSSAAAALVCLVGYTYSRHAWLRDPSTIARVERELAGDYIRLVVSGPAQLQPDQSNLFTFQAEDLNGLSTECTAEYELAAPDGQVLVRDNAHVDANADGVVAISGAAVEDHATLKVWRRSRTEESIALDVARAEPRYASQLATNQSVYAPGTDVFFRYRAALPVQNAQAPREFQLQFGCARVDAPDQPIDGLAVAGTTTLGVGNGSIKLPKDLPEGRYKLWAESPQQELAPQEVEFEVAQGGVEAWDTQLHFAEATAAPGEQVNGVVFAKTRAGEPGGIL